MSMKLRLQEWKSKNPLKAYRKQEGLTQPDLAAIVGVSVYTIQRWEDGSVSPSGENEVKLGKLIEGFSDQWNEWKDNKPSL